MSCRHPHAVRGCANRAGAASRGISEEEVIERIMLDHAEETFITAEEVAGASNI